MSSENQKNKFGFEKKTGKKQCFQKSLKNVQTNELIFQKPRTGSISQGKNETAAGPENGVRFFPAVELTVCSTSM